MERGELTPIQRILNTLFSIGKLGGEHYTAAKQQYGNLCWKLKNIEKFYPQKAIRSHNERKKKVIPEISEIKDDLKSRCPGLIKALELAVKLKKDEDGSARRELVMLLDTDYLEVKPKKGEDGRKKGGSTSSEKIEPNTIKMATLWEFLSDEKNMSLLDMSEQIAEQARGEFQQLRGEWEEILNREDKKVRSFLNSKDYPKKNSLSSMRVDDQDPLHKVMNRLAESKKILSQKDDIVYEYVTLVNVCTEFRRHAAPKREVVMKKVPAKENHPRGATNEKQTEERRQKSPERTRDEGSEVDQKSYLDILLQTYCEDMDINEDEKEKSRQEFLKLEILRGRYGPPKGSVPNVDPPKDGKLENIVNEDQKGVSESLFSVLRYAKKKGLEKWQLAAAEFGRLADVLISIAKEDNLGARPKVQGPDFEGKGSALYELLLKWDGADQIMKDKAKMEYVKISDKARKLPTLKAEHQDLGQSVSMLINPKDIPDDPESTTYNVLQILRATDPEGKKCRGAWNEYFCLLAEEQRFIRIIHKLDFKRTSNVPETIYPPEHFVVQSVQVSSDHDDWKECGQHKSHGAAEWKCINCRRTFCGACKEFHDKMVPKKHHLLHRSKREKEAIILKEIFCNIHLNKELEMYCITDNRAICVLCALGPSHKDHTIEELEKSADKIRSDVGVLLANVDKDYPKMEEYLRSVRKTIANASLPEYNDLVDKMMEKAIAQIKLNAANLKADEKRKADKLKKQEADLKSQQEEIQSKLLSSRKFLETCTDLQLVTQGKRYLQELGDIVLPDMSNGADERPGQLTEVDIQQHISRNIFS